MDIYEPRMLSEAYRSVYKAPQQEVEAYEAIVEYLASEGLVESYEEADELIESMSDDEIVGILDEANYQPLTGKRLRRVMRQAANLAARSERFRNPEVQAMAKRNSGASPADIKNVIDRSSDRSDIIIDIISKHDPKKAQQRERNNRNTIRVTATPVSNPTLRGVKESYDLILSHLIDEGYADSEVAAEAILESMSEEWMESILSEANLTARLIKAIGRTNPPPKGARRSLRRELMDYLFTRKIRETTKRDKQRKFSGRAADPTIPMRPR